MPGQLRTFCEVEWPSVGVDWPPEGTVSLNHKGSLCYSYGKAWTPQQFPYIDSWLGIAQDPPPKMGPFYAHGGGRKNLDGPKGNQG